MFRESRASLRKCIVTLLLRASEWHRWQAWAHFVDFSRLLHFCPANQRRLVPPDTACLPSNLALGHSILLPGCTCVWSKGRDEWGRPRKPEVSLLCVLVRDRSNAFSAFTKWLNKVFHLICWYSDYVVDFLIWTTLAIQGTTLLGNIILVIHCWILFAYGLFRSCVSLFSDEIALQFSFFTVSF